LSQVLEATAPPRFSLSAKAASGILRRAERRGKTLPEALKTALTMVSGGVESRTVRRLTPMECERLMGWPDGWTLSQRWRSSARERIENFKREIGRLG
jgi:site-specific DNA-cytosine methylase